jgi:tRNA (cmo5U34)-methyltransferase
VETVAGTGERLGGVEQRKTTDSGCAALEETTSRVRACQFPNLPSNPVGTVQGRNRDCKRGAASVGSPPVTEWDWNPDTFLDEMHEEVPGYEDLQAAVADASDGVDARRVLELGTGTGETALRVQARHPAAVWVGVDASEAMLARARERLPGADLRLGRLEDELPEGPFDLVISVLAVHHLAADAKRDLFTRLASVVEPGGRFVLGDLVVPPPGEHGPIVVDWEIDVPDSVADQQEWLAEAGFVARSKHVRPDLAVIVADLPSTDAGPADLESPRARGVGARELPASGHEGAKDS